MSRPLYGTAAQCLSTVAFRLTTQNREKKMRYTHALSFTFISALLISVAGGGCSADAGAPKDESALGTTESELRSCEAACQNTMIACHNGCGANGPCHNSCDSNYQSCLGSWQATTPGHSICR